ncbi:MAG: PAS domain S-box protein [Desulfobulbaceae bacterium]|nr:PAS domain S-box protein [Desulfobulbaceae bacterium]
MHTLPMYPTVLIDLIGSGLMILITFLALRYAYFLSTLDSKNFIWGFLLYFCMAMAAFSISRGVGHILKQILVLSGHKEIWIGFSPYSGGFNTTLMIYLYAVIIYYHKGLAAYEAIQGEASKLFTANKKLEDATGELQKMNVHLEDMVEERTKELSESEKKFRHFFENSQDMVYFCDSEGSISDINQSGLEMLGYKEWPEDLNILDIFNNESELEVYVKALHEKGFVRDFEIELQNADGNLLQVVITANAVRDETGKMIGCEGIAKDMTRLKTVMAQLADKQKMASVGQLAAGVAHEINTPLGVILGYSQLMKDDFPEGDESYESLVVIERQTKACRKIVADLLKFSRQGISEKTYMQLNEIVQDVVDVTEHGLIIDHIKVTKKYSEEMPFIFCDAEKLRQVFINLINNAHHAMEGGGEIIISTRLCSEEQEVEAVIEDTGKGIPDEVKAKIFEPFFTTKAVGKGTGLGLSVSYGIIQDHDGSITVQSPVVINGTIVHSGTAFTVRLPVASEQPDAESLESMLKFH